MQSRGGQSEDADGAGSSHCGRSTLTTTGIVLSVSLVIAPVHARSRLTRALDVLCVRKSPTLRQTPSGHNSVVGLTVAEWEWEEDVRPPLPIAVVIVVLLLASYSVNINICGGVRLVGTSRIMST